MNHKWDCLLGFNIEKRFELLWWERGWGSAHQQIVYWFGVCSKGNREIFQCGIYGIHTYAGGFENENFEVVLTGKKVYEKGTVIVFPLYPLHNINAVDTFSKLLLVLQKFGEERLVILLCLFLQKPILIRPTSSISEPFYYHLPVPIERNIDSDLAASAAHRRILQHINVTFYRCRHGNTIEFRVTFEHCCS